MPGGIFEAVKVFLALAKITEPATAPLAPMPHPYKEGQNRQEVLRLPPRLDDWVGADNPVRAMDAYVEPRRSGTRFLCPTYAAWEEAVQARIQQQNGVFRNTYPSGSPFTGSSQ
ncbi:hypothetical protein Metal_3137 [Methylomicrobium album BG8]|uniref:Uncharacterized protein n=1 Tax=Methylomicrobium album BG8 TaxID=686340 RepID=H8GNQ6_METAL|nr:hypothetical protein Metal_3137 [Methylomicrobium album BG8]